MLSRQLDLAAIAQELPNGIHDADIEEFSYNVAKGVVSFDLDIWIGTKDSAGELQEQYRRGRLTFEGVVFFTKTESAYLADSGMSMLNWTLEEDLEEKAKLPGELTAKFFYLAACYCQFRISCEDVWFEWTDAEPTNRYR